MRSDHIVTEARLASVEAEQRARTANRRRELEILHSAIGSFIKASPDFDGDIALAEAIGTQLGRLQMCLEDK